MKRNDELTGTFVLVRPDLTFDPAEKKNQIGIITTHAVEGDTVMVSFGRGGQALFTTDALLVLREPEEISHDLDNDATLLPREDYLDIKDIISFADSNLKSHHRAAIELARTNPTAMEYALSTLEMELSRSQESSIGR